VVDFLAAAGEPEPPLPNPHPTEKVTAYRSSSRGWAAVLALVVLAAGGFAAWRLNLGPFATHAAPQSSPPPVQPPPVVTPAQTASTDATGAPSTTPADGSASASPASTDQSKSTSPATPEEGFVLLVRAKQDSWLSISADGQLVMAGTLPAAETREVRARKSVVLKLGNAAGVEVSYNNTVMPPLGRANEVKTVVFTPEGLQP